jgi:signal transduction histidine kinase
VGVSISDTGGGIPKEVKDKIFEPFFTTKEVGKGTGLGLSICFGIIEEHKGTIEIETEKGQGTTFIIIIPAKPV